MLMWHEQGKNKPAGAHIGKVPMGHSGHRHRCGAAGRSAREEAEREGAAGQVPLQGDQVHGEAGLQPDQRQDALRVGPAAAERQILWTALAKAAQGRAAGSQICNTSSCFVTLHKHLDSNST